MKIGTVKEIMDNEYRVGLSASSVLELVSIGYQVYIEKDAGLESGITNDDYIKAGGTLVNTADEVWEKSDLIVKVKEPQPREYHYLRKNLAVFSFLHLSAYPKLTDAFIKNKATAIAFETVETKNKDLPVLKPMSQIAGKMAAILGAEYLQKSKGGSGVLISGIPGVKRANALVVGAGNVGVNSLDVLVGLGAKVTIVDLNVDRLSELEQIYGNKIETLYSNSKNIEEAISEADLVIGAISLPGSKTPQLIKRSYYKNMKKGSVIIDVAIDQGGSAEASKKTSHQDPVFYVDGILHYGVPNIPGAVPLSATEALNNAIINYIKLMAEKGIDNALKTNYDLRNGANIVNGKVVNQAVATSLNLKLEEI